MIAAAAYLILITGLILYNRFFGLFRDEVLGKKKLAVFFVLKALAIPAFYYLYQFHYGGLHQFDSGKFHHDVQVIHHYAYADPENFLRLMAGLQEESYASEIHRECIRHTLNWDNGAVKDYFYNDNRILIRVHVLLDFIAFRSWFVHALFSCFFSFGGLFMLYRTFRESFRGKETLLFGILCFFPALWFYTGGFLKEGLTLLILGGSLLAIRRTIHLGFTARSLWLIPLLLLCCLLKPYLLLFAAVIFALYFMIGKLHTRFRLLIFLGVTTFLLLLANLASLKVKDRSLSDAALRHQRNFAGMSRGGIFLAHKNIYLRLEYDSSLVTTRGDSLFTIRRGAAYTYWDDARHNDTLHCASNTDTSTVYRLQWMSPPAGSDLKTLAAHEPFFRHLAQAFYNSLLYPLFFNAGSFTALVVSFENLLIILSLLICLLNFIRQRQSAWLPAVFLFFALSLCLLAGFSTPNMGAVFRYRAPAVIFILMAGLYYLPPGGWRKAGGSKF